MKCLLPLLLSLTIFACSANPAVTETLPPTNTPPTETPTTLPPTPVPQLTVMDGYGEGLSDLTLKNITGGMYDAQIEGLKTSYKKWTEDGSLTVEGEPQIVFIQDQNNDPKGVYAVILSGDTYIFPPLRLVPGEIPAPAYDATDNVNAPLKIKKTLTIDDVPNLVESGYTEEMANWLVDNAPDFAVRGRQFVRMKNNKVAAYLGPEGQWVKEETRFEIVPEFTEAHMYQTEKLPYISQEDIDSGAWLQYVMRQTESMAPDLSKIIWGAIGLGGRDIRHNASREDEAKFWTDPDNRESKRASWAMTDTSFNNGSPFDTVKAVAYYRKDGGIVWAQVIGHSNPGIGMLDDLPNRNTSFSQTSRAFPEDLEEIILNWDINDEVPLEIDGRTLFSFFY